MICQICKAEFNTLRSLHAHLNKVHSFSQESYYHYFYPRYDLGSNELINYKNYDQYFDSCFNSRVSFVDWASKLDSEEKISEVKSYCLGTLKKRASEQKLNYFPSHVELKSLLLPSMFGLQKIWGGFDGLFKEVTYATRFHYSQDIKFSEESYQVYIDTREQLPLNFENRKVVKLSIGDYAPSAPLFADVFIERKSLNDLAGTLSSGFDRFEKEIKRAKSLNGYLVVVVESTFTDAETYSPYNSFSKKINGAFLFHNIRKLMQENDNVQFVFTGTRKRCMECIDNIFRLRESAKTLDLEYLKDGGII